MESTLFFHDRTMKQIFTIPQFTGMFHVWGQKNAEKMSFYPVSIETSHLHTWFIFVVPGIRPCHIQREVEKWPEKDLKITLWLYKIFFFLFLYFKMFHFCYLRSSTCLLLHTHFYNITF